MAARVRPPRRSHLLLVLPAAVLPPGDRVFSALRSPISARAQCRHLPERLLEGASRVHLLEHRPRAALPPPAKPPASPLDDRLDDRRSRATAAASRGPAAARNRGAACGAGWEALARSGALARGLCGFAASPRSACRWNAVRMAWSEIGGGGGHYLRLRARSRRSSGRGGRPPPPGGTAACCTRPCALRRPAYSGPESVQKCAQELHTFGRIERRRTKNSSKWTFARLQSRSVDPPVEPHALYPSSRRCKTLRQGG